MTQPNPIRQSSVPGVALGDYSDQTPGPPPGPRAVSAVINSTPWVTATEYVANQLVTNSGTLYIAKFAHTSADDFSDDAFNWTALATDAGGPPTGAAGGDLSGSYPDPTVSKVDGRTIVTTSGATGDVLTQQSDGTFAPEAAPGGGVNQAAYIVEVLLTVGTVLGADHMRVGGSFASPDGELPALAGGGVAVPPAVMNAGETIALVPSPTNDVLSGISPTATDATDMVAEIIVSNTLGTEVMTVLGNAQVAMGDTHAAIDWSTATVLQQGSDLVWDNTAFTIKTTAGGIFASSMQVNVTPD